MSLLAIGLITGFLAMFMLMSLPIRESDQLDADSSQ